MKKIENEAKNIYQLSKKDKVNDTIMKINTSGSITYEGEYSFLRFQRILPHPAEIIWKEITDPKQLSEWMNTKAIINGKNGGTIDFVNTISGFHTLGDILTWDLTRFLNINGILHLISVFL